MSEIDRITKITDRAGTGAPNFTFGVNFAGSDSGISPHTHTESASEPGSPSNGDTWWDSDNDIYKVYMNNEWKDWLGTSAAAATPWTGDRAVVSGRYDGSNAAASNQIQRFDITTQGNSVDFGDLTTQPIYQLMAGSSARTLSGGGYNLANNTRSNVIDYFSPATPGNAQDFGDLTVARNMKGAHSNGTRCLWCGGMDSGFLNTVDYSTIANTGNATDFGDLSSAAARGTCGSTGDATRAVHALSLEGNDATVDYFTYASAGNATDFGDLTRNGANVGGCADATRAVFSGAANATNDEVIDYLTVQSTGNATDFGDLNTHASTPGACANATRGITLGNATSGSKNNMDYYTIQTAANAADFADLTSTLELQPAAASGAAS